MATYGGIRCQVRVLWWLPNEGGRGVMDLESSRADLEVTPRFAPLTGFGGPLPGDVYEGQDVTVTLRDARRAARRSTAEQMALAVLDGDLAAAGPLADHVLADLGAEASGGDTRDSLLARIEDLQRQLRDAGDRIEALQNPYLASY